MTVERGFYRHHKGGTYWVYGISRNDDSGEELVIYESVQSCAEEPHRMRHRTVAEFTETVEVLSPFAGEHRPRFVRVEKW